MASPSRSPHGSFSPPEREAFDHDPLLQNSLSVAGRSVGPGQRAVRLLGLALLVAAISSAALLGVSSVARARQPSRASASVGLGLAEDKSRHKGEAKHGIKQEDAATEQVRQRPAHRTKAKEPDADDADAEVVTDADVVAATGATKCSGPGASCSLSGCCSNPGEHCYAGGFVSGVPLGSADCKATGTPKEVKWTTKRHAPGKHTTWTNKDGIKCHSRFVPPPVPSHGSEHNGVSLPTTCFTGTGEHHVFIISDWGGIVPGHKGNSGPTGFNHLAPADHTKFGGHMRDYQNGTDEWAQHRVAKQVRLKAKKSKPDYFLNGGDAFYWGGIETHCGVPPHLHAHTGQWSEVFEQIYYGPGVDGKQWLGVLGNHDYGGWMYISAWDQVIGYTWGGPESSGRWMLPAQYYSAKVVYDDVTVDYYFVDTNYFDSDDANHHSGHNLCNGDKIGASKFESCGVSGPHSAQTCPTWFKKLWEDQKKWLAKVLKASTSDWQIVVTHFPPTWGKDQWPAIARDHGIDLIITGHKHQQEVHVPDDALGIVDGWSGLYTDFLGGTGWVISGGGGGVTSQGMPNGKGDDDQYGFVDMIITRYKITLNSYSHGGQLRSSKSLGQRHPAIANPDYLNYLTSEQRAMEKPNPKGCGTNKRTFYLYRAQDDENYPDTNVNAANLAGVLWYLHHEVVMECPRKFGITRIRRLKVTVQNTCDLYKETKTQFGPYSAFDSGRCGVKGCSKVYKKYGSVVGCQHIPYNTGLFAAYCEQPNCGYPQWYSFPGPCTEKAILLKDKKCKKEDPGGFCKDVTGERDCTYHVESAGFVRLDDLYKTVTQYYPWDQFCKSQMEYNNKTDYGLGVTWWDEIYSPARCRERYLNVTAAFKKKYPDMPESLPEPRCDYYDTDPKDFFRHTGSGFSRHFNQRKLR